MHPATDESAAAYAFGRSGVVHTHTLSQHRLLLPAFLSGEITFMNECCLGYLLAVALISCVKVAESPVEAILCLRWLQFLSITCA